MKLSPKHQRSLIAIHKRGNHALAILMFIFTTIITSNFLVGLLFAVLSYSCGMVGLDLCMRYPLSDSAASRVDILSRLACIVPAVSLVVFGSAGFLTPLSKFRLLLLLCVSVCLGHALSNWSYFGRLWHKTEEELLTRQEEREVDS